MSAASLMRLSVACAAALLVACGDSGATDAAMPDAPRPTGDFSCGSRTCTEAQMCVIASGGTDTGTGPSYSCIARPAECAAATDCSGSDCTSEAACISSACGFAFSSGSAMLGNHGRTVSCFFP